MVITQALVSQWLEFYVGITGYTIMNSNYMYMHAQFHTTFQ